MTSGSFWNYYRDEVNNSANEHNDANSFKINNKKTATITFFFSMRKICAKHTK